MMTTTVQTGRTIRWDEIHFNIKKKSKNSPLVKKKVHPSWVTFEEKCETVDLFEIFFDFLNSLQDTENDFIEVAL